MYYTLLSPKVDFVFKKIFGNEQHPEILISFLNAVIQSDDPIKSVEIKNTDIEKEYINAKFSRLDIRALTDKNEQINVEIQVRDEYNMVKRSLYYWSKMYDSQLEKRGKYESLKRTICINVLDFSFLSDDKFHSVYRLKDIKTNEELTDVMEIHFIELPKAKNTVTDNNILQAWVNFINNPGQTEIKNQEMQDAMNELVRLSSDKDERFLYEKRLESIIELNSSMDSGFKRGIEQGIEKGRAEGLKRGIEQGIEKGKIETSLQIAKNLLKAGTDIETICSATKLTREEIEQLKEHKSSVNKMNLF